MSAPLAHLAAHLDPPLVVVTTAAGDDRGGCLVSFHSQSSIDPFRYSVWISKANHTYRVALFADTMAVHFLTVGDDALAAHFGSETGDEVDKFAGSDWEPGPNGVPLLTRVRNRLVGRITGLSSGGGDHVCIELDPIATGATEEQPQWLYGHQLGDVAPGHPPSDRQLP